VSWMVDSEELTEDRALRWLWRIMAPTLLTIGTVGNVLGLMVLMLSPSFRGRRGGAVAFALSALCCSDQGLLMTSVLRRCLLHWTGFDLSTTSPLSCRLHFFLVHLFSQLSSITVALLSADRAVTVWHSVPAAGLSGRRRMAVLWSAAVCILCVVNLHFFWTAEHTTALSVIASLNNTIFHSGFSLGNGHITSQREASTACYNQSARESTSDMLLPSTLSQLSLSVLPKKFPVDGTFMVTASPGQLTETYTAASEWTVSTDVEYCLIGRRYIRFYLDVWYWIDLTLWAVGPFIAITVSNVAVVIRLTRFDEFQDSVEEPRRSGTSTTSFVRSKNSSLSSSSSVHTRTPAISGRSRRVTSSTMMLLVVSFTFVLTNSPMSVCMLGYETWLNRASSLRDVARLRLFHGVCSVLSFTGNASNFLLYCVGGSRFRRALRDAVVDWSRRIAAWWATTAWWSTCCRDSEMTISRRRTDDELHLR